MGLGVLCNFNRVTRVRSNIVRCLMLNAYIFPPKPLQVVEAACLNPHALGLQVVVSWWCRTDRVFLCRALCQDDEVLGVNDMVCLIYVGFRVMWGSTRRAT